MGSTDRSGAESPARVIAPHLTSLDGQVWRTCPYGGAECYRVSVDILGASMAADAVAWHVGHSHRAWR